MIGDTFGILSVGRINGRIGRVPWTWLITSWEHRKKLGYITVRSFDSHRTGVATIGHELLPLPLLKLPAEGAVAVGGILEIPENAELMDVVQSHKCANSREIVLRYSPGCNK